MTARDGEPAQETVAVRCPDCPWESEPSAVGDGPNCRWFAFRSPMAAYRHHRQIHHWVEPIMVTHNGGIAQGDT